MIILIFSGSGVFAGNHCAVESISSSGFFNLIPYLWNYSHFLSTRKKKHKFKMCHTEIQPGDEVFTMSFAVNRLRADKRNK